jgi:hypothetical protein
VEPSHAPDSASWGKEPLHRSGEILMLRGHPIAVCSNNTGKSPPIGLGEGVGKSSPLVGLDRNGSLL